MSAQRVRTPGNLPETRIICDSWRYDAHGTPCASLPVVDDDARAARRRARAHGWTRANGHDLCPEHGHLAEARR